MPVPLLQLPNRALKIVLQEMETVDIIEISLLSVRSKERIEEQLLKAEKLTFNEEWISLNFQWKEDPFYFLFSSDTSQIEGYRVLNEQNYFWNTNPEEKVICAVTKDVNKYLNALEYFCMIFQVQSFECDVSLPFNDKKLRKLPQTVKTMKLQKEMIDQDAIATLMEYFDIEEELEVIGKITNVHEKMLNVNSIYLEDVTDLNIWHLTALNCRKIEIADNNLSNAHINFLIKNWKENNTQLEYLKITDNAGEFTLEEVLRGVDSKPWDPARRDGVFELGEEDVDCEAYLDIERDSDQMIASIGLEGTVLEMFVWKDPFPSRKYEEEGVERLERRVRRLEKDEELQADEEEEEEED